MWSLALPYVVVPGQALADRCCCEGMERGRIYASVPFANVSTGGREHVLVSQPSMERKSDAPISHLAAMPSAPAVPILPLLRIAMCIYMIRLTGHTHNGPNRAKALHFFGIGCH
ncbi:uncharacterized protein LAESUDRAFT_728631 [Laetiporus sulphureus 93-53]|uniref:Secreted protein n=1 Tax=Laetiporus sulphureus 93-53 TaxID=1314785 RepID=A0A165D158_9APHY|nr:uncharacterized protein LAESUDRAFT_728631 [Laetiporus sulphureus 93-53]KZT03932.1 hypothetical protein LAESUDRAFT_728631 [Laetiporus sulphureus 93-53]